MGSIKIDFLFNRRKYLLLPRGIKRKQGVSQRLQADPQREKDPIYADIRESYFSDTHGEMYACIDTKPGGKNTYRRRTSSHGVDGTEIRRKL